MTRRKQTDGESIAERMVQGWALSGAHVDATAKAIDRIIRKRMAEAWDEGWVGRASQVSTFENPHRGRRKK